jgi:hypothetical protein
MPLNAIITMFSIRRITVQCCQPGAKIFKELFVFINETFIKAAIHPLRPFDSFDDPGVL